MRTLETSTYIEEKLIEVLESIENTKEVTKEQLQLVQVLGTILNEGEEQERKIKELEMNKNDAEADRNLKIDELKAKVEIAREEAAIKRQELEKLNAFNPMDIIKVGVPALATIAGAVVNMGITTSAFKKIDSGAIIDNSVVRGIVSKSTNRY